MLVLTRKLQEEILVGDNIRIALLDIRGGKVRIGIEAPADVPVLRSELRESDATLPLRVAQRGALTAVAG